jgi:RimJ/RimL family protein N-acetyltransferase
MPVRLVPMDQDDFAAFLKEAIPDYARDKVRVGNWQPDEAIERSRREFENLLPQGPTTPNIFLWKIEDAESATKVGILWLGVQERNGEQDGFVYDVRVFEPYRRRGYASAAFRALEAEARWLGLASIGLHVFGDNHAARALYQKLGYVETNVNMRKLIE